MNKKTAILASVLTALLIGLPMAGFMEYGKRKTEPMRAELVNNGIQAELDSFIKQHSLSQNDMRYMIYHKPLPFLNAWLSCAFTVGVFVGIFILLRNGLIRLIEKNKTPNHQIQPIGGKDAASG